MRVLNASRHRISLRPPLSNTWRAVIRCSTPLGIGYRYASAGGSAFSAARGAQRLSASDIATRLSPVWASTLLRCAQRLSASDIATPQISPEKAADFNECSTPLGIGYRYARLGECFAALMSGAQRLSASDIATPEGTFGLDGGVGCSTPLGIGYRYADTRNRHRRFAPTSAQRLSASDIATLAVHLADFASRKCSTPLGIGYRYASS